MKWFFAALLFHLVLGDLQAQQRPLPPATKKSFVDEAGQRISFVLPAGWRFANGIITNLKGTKVAELLPGTLPDCPYKNGAVYLRELKAGYPDDMDARFVGSRTWLLRQTTWTEGIRNTPAWDGRANTGRWYTHNFFALLNKKCFLMTFFSPQRQLQDEEKVRSFLASLTLN